MAKNTSITLGEHFAAFVEEQVSRGRYGNASEVVRAGLRLLEEKEAKLKALRVAIKEGLESGPAEPFDVEAFIAEKDRGQESA
jgi:antitoxin ParD1/3/4